MSHTEERFAALGCLVPEILLPAAHVSLEQWAVIACDQYTQDRSYWAKAAAAAGGAPSALNIVFPEVYLEDADRAQRIENIRRIMRSYLEGGVFSPPRRACMYVERTTAFHKKRQGLVMALDLEQYDWASDARLLIRSTEGTVPGRLPPRMDIRRGAPLEIPHILVLVDDQGGRLMEGLAGRAEARERAYHTGLMLDGGGVSGWYLDREDDWTFIADCFEDLSRRSVEHYGERYGADQGRGAPFLFAVGDGNHSLATAKAIWEEYKEAHGKDGNTAHPLRWALVEIENIYDPGIQFEPIHRVLFNAAPAGIAETLSALPGFKSRPVAGREELLKELKVPVEGKNRLGLVRGGDLALLETSAKGIATAGLQPLLDAFVKKTSCGIDYIHGEDEVFRLAADGEKTGILLPPVRKAGLFETVACSGPLPRKSFSMGEAAEKRFYLEARQLA